MRILMVSSAFPPHFGGAAVQATYLAQGLHKRGVAVEFITDNERRPSVHELYRGIPVYRCASFFDNRARTGKRSELVFAARVLLYVLRHGRKYDIIHFHSMRGAESFTFPLLKLLGKQLIYKLTLVGNDDPMAFKRRNFMGKAYLWGLSYIDRFIAIASVQIDLTEQAGLERARVLHLPNGVDTGRYAAPAPADRAALKARLGLDGYDKVFYSIGKIEDRKHYKFLLRAWRHLAPVYPGSAIVFAGPGNTDDNPYYVELRAMIAEHGLSGVLFLGHRDNVDDYMKVADAFLFASKSEGFGTVLIEAAVTGVPVVALNIEGVTEDIVLPEDRDLARICYDREDPKAFADTTVDLLSRFDPAGRARALARFQRVYDLDHIAGRYVELYQQMLGDKRSPGRP